MCNLKLKSFIMIFILCTLFFSCSKQQDIESKNVESEKLDLQVKQIMMDLTIKMTDLTEAVEIKDYIAINTAFSAIKNNMEKLINLAPDKENKKEWLNIKNSIIAACEFGIIASENKDDMAIETTINEINIFTAKGHKMFK